MLKGEKKIIFWLIEVKKIPYIFFFFFGFVILKDRKQL